MKEVRDCAVILCIILSRRYDQMLRRQDSQHRERYLVTFIERECCGDSPERGNCAKELVEVHFDFCELRFLILGRLDEGWMMVCQEYGPFL